MVKLHSPVDLDDDYHQEMLLWTRLRYNPAQPKSSVYVESINNLLPMLDARYPFSNFDSVFTKQDTNITGQFSVSVQQSCQLLEALDVSGIITMEPYPLFRGKNYGGQW